jgi:hypothetical protein
MCRPVFAHKGCPVERFEAFDEPFLRDSRCAIQDFGSLSDEVELA